MSENRYTPTHFTAPRPAALPYLAVADARRALQWYTDALGAVVVGDPIVMDDGRIGHAELAVGGGVLYLADEFPELGLRAPADGVVSVSLMLPVPDTDAALERARDRGARVHREVQEAYGARGATIVDPFGHRWMLSGPMRGTVAAMRHGDVGYVSIWTPDAARAAAFYGHVLGWTFDPDSAKVTNTVGQIGIFAAGESRGLFCCYAVADITDARRAILDAGGRADDITRTDHGMIVGATDPAGTAFAVFQTTGDVPRPALNGAGPGELSYLTHEVTDSATTREFYGRVLHWAFESGRVDDGWEIVGSRPMSGLVGGADRPVTVPMWTVADIDIAVRAVSEAGGTVLAAPTRQPYGLMAECTDDQGTRFYLGQF